MSARCDARILRRHRARRKDRQGALALPYHSWTGRAWRRIVGRRADESALARRHMDGAELRPRAESDHHRNVRDDSRAEVHARGCRQAVPVSQLHARHQRRHRQAGVVLPAHRRSLGPRSSIRAAARRHRSRAERVGGPLDQSEGPRRRTAQGRHRHRNRGCSRASSHAAKPPAGSDHLAASSRRS